MSANNKVKIVSVESKLKKGYAVIFNQEIFNENLNKKNRIGTVHDVKILDETLTYFNIDINVKQDLDHQGIKTEVDKLAKFDFSPYNCLFVIVLTHGEENNVLFARDEQYNLYDTIVNPIVDHNESLSRIPKIFIIQACKKPLTKTEKDKCNFPSAFLLPSVPDMYFAFSTYEGYFSSCDDLTGGIFIQRFCNLIREYGETEYLTTIMEKVTKQLIEKNEDQVPTTISTMAKPFCFGDMLK